MDNLCSWLHELALRVHEATDPKKKDILVRQFYELLVIGGKNDEFGRVLHSFEFALYVLAIPVNLVVCWSVVHTNTFHPNLRLILFSNIMCGLMQALIQSVFVLNSLTNQTLISPRNNLKLFGLRAFFVNQMLLSFLNVFIERYIAYKLSEKYEKLSLHIGILIIALWWVVTYLLTYVIPMAVVTSLCIISPCVALYLADHWIKTQSTIASKLNAPLSKRYQMNENIKTLHMCRPWIVYYTITNVVHACLITFLIIYFLMEKKNLAKILCYLADILYAFYVLTYTLFLVYGHKGLRKKLKRLFRKDSRVNITSYNCIGSTILTNKEDFNSHFRRLEQAWN